jgi:hypothetical protein
MPSAPESGAIAVALAELQFVAEVAARKLPDNTLKKQLLRHLAAAMVVLEHGEFYDATLTTNVCLRCGRRFSFNEEHFRDHGLPSPRRCDRCRKDRREENQALGRAGGSASA